MNQEAFNARLDRATRGYREDAPYTLTGCGHAQDDPKGPTFDAAWKLYSDGAMPLADTFDLAAGIECIDGVWKLNACPAAAAAGLHTLGDGMFALHDEGKYEAWFARLGCYNRIREALEAIYPTIPGGVSDPWTADTYSELYKDDNGFRPGLHVSGETMRTWIARRDAE